jgi:hypothetical protein
MLTSGAVLSLDDIDDARDQRASREDEIRQQDDQQARKMERRRTQEAQRRERQRSYVRRLVDDSHGVEMARMLILANRSVKTWSEQMNQRIIAAYIDLRDIRHDQQTSIDSGHPIFPDWGKIEESFGKRREC